MKKGFTLIETLIALVIIGLIMSSGIFASMQRIQNQQQIQQKTIAMWSINNTWQLMQHQKIEELQNVQNSQNPQNIISCPQGKFNFICSITVEPIHSKKDFQQILAHRFNILVKLNNNVIEQSYFYRK